MTRDEQVKYIFDTLKAAKVSIVNFSKLTSISRESLYRWKDGGNITDRLRLNLAYSTATRIAQALDARALPMVGVPAKEKLSALRAILAKTIRI